MKLTGLVKIFTVALILISLYRLSFTFVSRSVEKKAKQQAESFVTTNYPTLTGMDKDAQIQSRYNAITDSMNGETVFNFLGNKYTFQQIKEKELGLGLDLKGGMNVTLEVSLDELVRSMSNNPKDPLLNKAIEEANRLKANSQSDFVALFGQSWKSLANGRSLASLFTKPSEKDITLNSTDEQVLKEISKQAKDAINRTYNVIQTRIDRFGVVNPNVNLDENKGIITVELAGENNPERVRTILQATAQLQFWEVYSDQNLGEAILNADKALAAYLKGQTSPVTTTDKTEDATTLPAAESTGDSLAEVKAVDSNSIADLLASDTANTADSDSLMAASEQPLLSLFIQSQDPAAIAAIQKKNINKFLEYMKLDVVKSKMPSNVKLLLEADTRNNPNALVSIFAIKTVPGSSKAKLEGDKVTDAKMDYDMNNRPSISMTMNSSGARIWSKMTGDNKGRFIAIVLDDKVYSAPRVNDQIDGGRSSITGSFSVQEATDLANILKSGKLPAPAKIVQEQVVGPTLGAESIKGGSISLILSFVIIFTLMIVYYNTGGMVANIALILNLLLTAGFLATLGATLTMPGIAGLVLTIGMAVDTNVLVFERIKEELKKGKTYQQAVDDGYFRSYAPVLDGHITSLITAIILFIFGLGPVLGFATTQIIGLLLSMFCGLVVSRMITDIYMKRGKHFNYFTKITENMFKNVNFDFVGKRKIAYIISAIVLVLGIASFFNGFDQGVEFAGGRSYTVSLKDKTKITDVRSKLAPHFDGEFPVVKTIGTGNDVNITTSYLIEKPDANTSDEVRAKLHEALVKEGLIDASISQEAFAKTVIKEEKTVLPTISDDLKAGAVKATIYSLIAIFIYILARFRKWQFSMGTIIALLHDVLITIIVFSFLRNVVPFGLEIDQHFIAAILTVIGFSMNDTVVVFDRIRENFRLHPNETKAQIINRSINETLSRTVLTSLSVFLTILVLFIFGGEVLRGFSFAMLVGVLTGVYSTIFVAAPFLLDMDKTNTLKDEVDREAYIKKLKEEA